MSHVHAFAMWRLTCPEPPPPPPPQDQYTIFIDTTHCRLAPDEKTNWEVIMIAAVICIIVALVAFRMGECYKLNEKRGYDQVSSVERTSLCRVTKVSSKKKFSWIGAQGDNDETALKSTAKKEVRV